MFFDSLRRARALRLALVFSMAAAGTQPPAPRDTPAMAELKILATEMAEKGPLLSPEKFERFQRLMGQVKDPEALGGILSTAGMCAHGGSMGGSSGGSGGGSGGTGPATGGCPVRRRKGDLSHLLAIDYPF